MLLIIMVNVDDDHEDVDHVNVNNHDCDDQDKKDGLCRPALV